MREKTSHMPCVACDTTPTDKCHIRSKGAGGGMNEENIMFLCRNHHQYQHSQGWHKFAKEYPAIMRELGYKGWEFIDSFGTVKLVKKT